MKEAISVFIIADDSNHEGLPYGICESVEQAVEFIKEDFKDPYWMGGKDLLIFEYKVGSRKYINIYNFNGIKQE